MLMFDYISETRYKEKELGLTVVARPALSNLPLPAVLSMLGLILFYMTLTLKTIIRIDQLVSFSIVSFVCHSEQLCTCLYYLYL